MTHVFCCTIKNPITSLLFIDRILVTLNAYKITPLLVFNKIDLYDEKLKLIENKYINQYMIKLE